MIRLCLTLWFSLFGQIPAEPPAASAPKQSPLEKSAYFAFVDRDFIFTVEIIKPGVPLLNFVSMAEQDTKLQAKNIRLTMENRKVPASLFSIETANPRQPMVTAFMTMHPRSSFGFRLVGEFAGVREFLGVTVRIGDEDLQFAPLTNYDFEVLVSKVNKLNLESPDFSEDWHVLRLERMGSRSRARGR